MPFFLLELLEGAPLKRYLQNQGELPLAQAVRITLETVKLFYASHKQGLIHRDTRPANHWLEVQPFTPETG